MTGAGDVAIRAGRPDDFAAICLIYADAVRSGTSSYELEPPTEAEMATRLSALIDAGYPLLVAASGGSILGYAYAGPFRARPAYRFMVEDSIYVSADAKGRGLGAALLRELIDACTGLGFRQMVAVIGDGRDDSPSVRLHARLGFSHAGKLVGSGFKHGRWLDTTFMQLAMNGGRELPPDPDSLPERRLKG